MKKLAPLFAVLVLLLGMSGCGRLPVKNNKNQAPGNSVVQTDKLPQSSAAPSSKVETDSKAPAQSKKSESINSAAVSAAVPTQQKVLKQVHAALSTKIPLMLPKELPVDRNRYLTAVTKSLSKSYKAAFYETSRPAAPNTGDAAKGTPIAMVEGMDGKSADNSGSGFFDYEKVDPSAFKGENALDLGHSIKAVDDVGLGHQILTWNEGRWCFHVDSPSDTAYQSKKCPGRMQMAESVASYLENHMLPVPQKIGVADISVWQRSYGATVKWQYHQVVYQVVSKDPLTALKVAVAMRFD